MAGPDVDASDKTDPNAGIQHPQFQQLKHKVPSPSAAALQTLCSLVSLATEQREAGSAATLRFQTCSRPGSAVWLSVRPCAGSRHSLQRPSADEAI